MQKIFPDRRRGSVQGREGAMDHPLRSFVRKDESGFRPRSESSGWLRRLIVDIEGAARYLVANSLQNLVRTPVGAETIIPVEANFHLQTPTQMADCPPRKRIQLKNKFKFRFCQQEFRSAAVKQGVFEQIDRDSITTTVWLIRVARPWRGSRDILGRRTCPCSARSFAGDRTVRQNPVPILSFNSPDCPLEL